MYIKPSFITFEQAKLLKQKGLVAKSDRYWVQMTQVDYKEISDYELDDLNRDVGIGGNLVIIRYHQWQVVEWLRLKYGIWISVDMVYDEGKAMYWYSIREQKENDTAICSNDEYDSPQEAYSAAFDYILKQIT